MTVLGGSRHFLGPVAGAFAFFVLEDFSLRLTEYRGLVVGLLLVAFVIAFPGGLAGTASRLASRWSRPARA
jgi:branched-chain amino acid transport system permease protein